jgi:SAM-dependent methyltransferase
MCNTACLEFGHTHLSAADVQGKAVLEVGARNVNGSLRSFVEGLSPSLYIGVDVEPGMGVDEVCRAEDVLARFGLSAFDLLISTELLEHVHDWRTVITSFKSVLRPNGVLLITTRSRGFPYHGYPHDYWRYELADMKEIFADFEIEALEPDPSMPGVFVRARKPAGFTARDLNGIHLQPVVRGKWHFLRRLKALVKAGIRRR